MVEEDLIGYNLIIRLYLIGYAWKGNLVQFYLVQDFAKIDMQRYWLKM